MFQADQNRIKAEAKLADAERRQGNSDRTFALNQRAQDFKERLGTMKFASDAEKARAKSLVDRANLTLRQAHELNGALKWEEAAKKVAEADQLIKDAESLGNGTELQMPNSVGMGALGPQAPAPVEAGSGMSLEEAKAAYIRERDRLGLQPGSPEAKSLQEQFKARVR